MQFTILASLELGEQYSLETISWLMIGIMCTYQKYHITAEVCAPLLNVFNIALVMLQERENLFFTSNQMLGKLSG